MVLGKRRLILRGDRAEISHLVLMNLTTKVFAVGRAGLGRRHSERSEESLLKFLASKKKEGFLASLGMTHSGFGSHIVTLNP
jgi:hypothetical protein